MPNELLPIDPIERFLTLKQAALCNKRFLPSLNIQIRRFPLQLPLFVWSFSSYTQSQTFHLLMKKLTIHNRQIVRSHHRNLKKTCQHGQQGFQIFAGFVFVEWSSLAGFLESCFVKIISPLSILGEFSPSSLLKSLSDTQHKSWVGLWSISDSFKICSLMVRFSDKKASDRRNSDSDGFLRT